MAKVLGLACKTYYNATDTGIAPEDFTEATQITSVSIDGSRATADVSTRGTAGYRAKVGTLKEGTVSFEVFYDTSADANTFFDALETAYQSNTAIIFWFGNGAISSAASRGFMASFVVSDFSESQELEDAVRYSVTLEIEGETPTPGYYNGNATATSDLTAV